MSASSSTLTSLLALSLALGPAPAAAQRLAPAAPTPATPPAPASAPPAPASAAASPAAGESRLAVLPITLSGSEDEAAGPRLFQHLQAGLARGAFALVEPAEVERLAPDGCSKSSCLDALRGSAGAAFVLRTTVTVDDRDYSVRLELLATRDAAVLASSEERCDLCGLAEVGALVEAQSALLRRQLEELIQGPPRLAVTTEPAGALVFVDDKLVGITPTEQTLLEGQHVVRVTLDGYVGDERRVELAAGVRETLALPLRREPKLARFRAIGWASLGVGVTAAITGIALLGVDGEPYRERCGPGVRDASGQCPFLFDTEWGGALTLAAGAALVTAGVMLLRRTRDRRAPTRPRAFLGPTGVTIVGRF